eukprot:3997465-Pyramimonas_sp.AAC.1
MAPDTASRPPRGAQHAQEAPKGPEEIPPETSKRSSKGSPKRPTREIPTRPLERHLVYDQGTVA